MFNPTYARPHHIEDPEVVHPQSQRGVVLNREAGCLVIAALRRDAYDMRQRGGDPNLKGAAEQEALADAIGKALVA